MGKKLIYEVDMTHTTGSFTGIMPVVIIEMNAHGGIDKVTVQMGNGHLYPAYLLRGEEVESAGE